MEEATPIGTFEAQYFKFLSGDPNTIFQFVVFPDRVFMLKTGSALNQLPQVLLHMASGPVGMRDHVQGNVPTVAELRDLVRKLNAEKSFSLGKRPVQSREIPVSDVISIEHREKGFFGKGLHWTLTRGEKMFFRFLKPEQRKAARVALAAVFKSRFRTS